MQRALSCVLIGALLSGCAVVDTGEIDYRRAEAPPPSVDVASYAESIDQCGPQAASVRLEQCKPLLSAALVRKNLSLKAPIKRSDVYSISIDHGLIARMIEPPFATRRLVAGRNPFRRVGEVLVLASVFEFPSGAEATSPRFLELTQLNDAKVVYYSPDVEVGQDLNFSNIPLQPPTRYNGNPVGIQIVVIELDRMSGPMQGLLKQLAQLGMESNMVPGGPAATTLVKLGTSMLANDHDDVIFEYRFVLDPSDDTESSGSPTFEAGRYVLRRGDERRADQIWRNIRLDHNTGKLMFVPKDATQGAPFEDDTYFTINVKKHPAGTEPSNYAFLTQAQLAEQIKTAADTRDRALTDVSTEVANKVKELRQKAWTSRLRDSWATVRSAGLDLGRKTANDAAVEPGVCTLRAGLEQQAQIAEVALRSATAQFIADFTEAMSKPEEFTEANKAEVLLTMAPFLTPVQRPIELGHLADPKQFETTFIGTGQASFIDAVAATAKVNWSPKSCKELANAGLADLVEAPAPAAS